MAKIRRKEKIIDTSALLDLETRSARISATLDQRPELAAIWRQSVALAEAGANLSLEDIPVTEIQIIDQMRGELSHETDIQAIRVAETVYRALMNPGHLLTDPGRVFDQAHRAGRLSSLVDIDHGGRASYPQIGNDPDWIEARELFLRGAPRLLRANGPISLKAISVAAFLCEIVPERHPIAERIVMMSAESFLRQDLSLRDPIVAPAYKELSNPYSAYWTLPPAMALSVGAFRAWSPASTKGQTELIAGLSRAISREAGRIGKIHAWMEKARKQLDTASKRGAKSLFLRMLFSTPIFDSVSVAKSLKVTDKTARNLIAEAENNDLIIELSSRRTYRIWAIAPISESLKERVSAADLRRSRPSQAQKAIPAAQPVKRPIKTEEDFDKKLDDIMAGLDDIMNATNKVLDKYVSRRTKRNQY